ncbi:MAG TPA: hypothetical protein H9694_06595 [Firmicutes bacterium]|nr:hypothetical protein [Bacillota bacterium]
MTIHHYFSKIMVNIPWGERRFPGSGNRPASPCFFRFFLVLVYPGSLGILKTNRPINERMKERKKRKHLCHTMHIRKGRYRKFRCWASLLTVSALLACTIPAVSAAEEAEAEENTGFIDAAFTDDFGTIPDRGRPGK